MASLGQRIREERKKLGLTQEDLGKVCGVTKFTISLYESNKSTPSDEIKNILAEYFGVTMDYLMGRTETRDYTDVFPGSSEPTKSLELIQKELNKRDLNDIEKDLEKMMDELHTNPNSGFAAYNGEDISEDDMELLKNAFKTALMTVKKINKEKYTPKKYKK